MGNTLFLDGSKFRANASKEHTLSKESIEKELLKIERHIDQMMAEAQRQDQTEDGMQSLVETKKKIENHQQLADWMKDCLTRMNQENISAINRIDPDAVISQSHQGSRAMHNVQCVTDDKNGLIVHAESVSKPNDNGELVPQIQQAVNNIGHSPKVVCADAGYFNPAKTKDIDDNIMVIMPSPQQAHEEAGTNKTPPGPFDKSHFQYNKEQDIYMCPEGKTLKYKGVDSTKPHRHIYRADASTCNQCPQHGVCTSGHCGRKVTRSDYDEIIRQQEIVYASSGGQAIYRRRKQRAEHPFGHLKRNFRAGQFLLRGREKVNAEISVLATCFNIKRLITIFGFAQLMTRFRAV